MQTISPLQVYYPKEWSGLTTDNHLSAIFANEPQLVSDVVSRVFGGMKYVGLDFLLSRVGVKELPTDNDYEWFLKGDDRKAINIVSYSASNMNKPGIGLSEFTIELAEKYFAYTDIIIFDDREYQVRIMGEPESNGVNWNYRVMLTGSNTATFVPPALLAAGKRVSKLYSSQESTLGRDYGQTSFTSPFKMRNIFSTLAKEYVVPGNMHDRPMVFSMLDPKSNKTTKVWTRYQEFEAMCQWVREKENNLLFSKFNKDATGMFRMKGGSGFPIMEGAGLREQISPSYKFYYTTFTVDYLLEILMNLSFNILPEDQRDFVLLTGERGMVQFHKAIENKVALFQPLDSKRLYGSGQNLGFGGQYVEFKGPQGIKVTLMRIPQYDDIVDNRQIHPDGGPTESYRYTILNFGTSGGENNIVKVYPKGRKDNMWYNAGSTSPFGPHTSINQMGSSKVDGYEVMMRTTQGIMIKNPMSCAELIYQSA